MEALRRWTRPRAGVRSARSYALVGCLLLGVLCTVYLLEPGQLNYDAASLDPPPAPDPRQRGGRPHCRQLDLRVNTSDQFQCVPTRTSPPAVVCLFDSQIDMFISHDLRETGLWEPHVLVDFLEYLDLNPTLGVIDIGANIGYYTLLAAARGHHVVAVEPFIDSANRLRRGVQLARARARVVVVTNAVADRRVSAAVRPSGHNQGDTRIDLEEDASCSGAACPAVIRTILMDDLLEVVRFREALMKIDIQGFEHRAFAHAARLLESVCVTYIFMEWMHMRPHYVRRAHDSDDKRLVNAMIVTLWTRRYRPYTLSWEGERPLDPSVWHRWPNDVVWHLKPNESQRTKHMQSRFINWPP